MRCPGTHSENLYAPVPTPFFESVSDAGSPMVQDCNRSVICSSASGCLKVTSRVFSSTAFHSLTTAIGPKSCWPVFGSAKNLRLAATASAVSGVPLWNLTPSRSVTVTPVRQR